MVTRDAKIGLLVGLAFILIVGILLSEHITTATTPQQADLALAGEKVREASVTPISPNIKPRNLKIDPDPQPQQPVATRDQLDSTQLPPTAKIELGTPESGQIKVIRIDTPDPVANAVQVKPDASTSAPPTKAEIVASAEKAQTVPMTLAEVAKEHGIELMAVTDGKPGQATPPLQESAKPNEEAKPIAGGSAVKEYVAVPGDSLSRMASRLMGASTPANQAAIVALNPSLQKDPSKILAGVKYRIPMDAWAAAMGNSASTPRTETSTPPERKTRVYEVKAGDSLWKIAEREVGNANAISQIKQLNADALGDSDVVKVGMKLKLPLQS